MRKLFSFLVISCSFFANAQEMQNGVLWYLPAANTAINGIGVGFVFEPLNHQLADSTKTDLNGLALEIVGFGVTLPLWPKSPFFPVKNADSALYEPIAFRNKINGIMLSAGGHVGESKINGLNLSGIGSCALQTNGFACAFVLSHLRVNGLSVALFSESVRMYGCQIGVSSVAHLMKGVQISGINEAEDARGLQVGLINRSVSLKGFQLGLWNVNSKRKLPIINWGF